MNTKNYFFLFFYGKIRYDQKTKQKKHVCG